MTTLILSKLLISWEVLRQSEACTRLRTPAASSASCLRAVAPEFPARCRGRNGRRAGRPRGAPAQPESRRVPGRHLRVSRLREPQYAIAAAPCRETWCIGRATAGSRERGGESRARCE